MSKQNNKTKTIAKTAVGTVADKPRAPRVRMSSGSKLSAPKRKGYQRYWQIDKPGLIDQMKDAYWEFVMDLDGRKRSVAAGGGGTLYLMEIKQEYYDEDTKEQQELITENTNTNAQKLDDGEYVLQGKKHVVQEERPIL